MEILMVFLVILAIVAIISGLFLFIKYTDFLSEHTQKTEPIKLDEKTLEEVKRSAKKVPEAMPKSVKPASKEKEGRQDLTNTVLSWIVVILIAAAWIFLAFRVLPGSNERFKVMLFSLGLIGFSYLMPKILPFISNGRICYGSREDGENPPAWFPDTYILQAGFTLWVISLFIPS